MGRWHHRPIPAMRSPSLTTPARITHAGSLTRASLKPGARGTVLAAVSNAVYLLTEKGELFWITSGDAPMHRRALRASEPLSGARAGSPFQVEDHCLTIDGGTAWEMHHPLIWDAPRINRGNLVEINHLPTRVHRIFSGLDLSGARGFGTFIPDILRLSQGAPAGAALEPADPILTFARPRVLEAASACLENRPSRIQRKAGALIGLGAGLTPSGDDFAGGLLFCVKTLEDVYRNTNSFDYSFSLEPFRAQTHLISFTLLQDLAAGHALSPLHLLINGILNKEPFEFVQQHFSRLTRVGHSTGWDLLAGLVTGLLITYASGYPPSSFRGIQSSRS
jgi:hypothetical protein